MAVTKSVLNSKLPKCGKPAIFTSITKGTSCTKAFCKTEDGAYSVTIGCKQPNKKNYSYQVQYRYHYRYTAATAAKKGADWSTYTDWRTPVAIAAKGSLPAIAANTTETNKPVNAWLRSNVGVNTKQTYKTLFCLENKTLGNYQAIAMQVRIRTFDAAKAKHGSWVVSDTLVVYDKANVEDEVLHTGDDGALDIDYNYVWDRGRTLHVTSVKDSNGRQLLRSAFAKTPQYDSRRSSSTLCPKRTGYQPGTNTIPVSQLKREMEPNEEVTITAWLETGDGAKTYLTSSQTVAGEDATLGAPRVTVHTLVNLGRIYINVYKTDADDDLLSVGANVSWTYLGKKYTANPTYSAVDTTLNTTTSRVAYFSFSNRLPLGVELTFRVTFKNRYKKTKSTTTTATIDTGSYAYLINNSNADVMATAYANMSVSLSTQHSGVIERPYGRALPFAAIDATGVVNQVTFTANIDERDSDRRASFQWWNSVRSNPGVYTLRLPDGQMYQLAITEVSISQEREGLRTVSFTGTEVS